jgi:parafibromin
MESKGGRALQLLRQYTVDKKAYTVNDRTITFGSEVFSKKIKVPLRKTGGARPGESPFYSLEAVLFRLKNVMSYGVYVAACTTNKVEQLSHGDGKVIIEWLTGLSDKNSLLVTKNEEFEDSGEDSIVPTDSKERPSNNESSRKRKYDSDSKYPLSKTSSTGMNGDSKFHSSASTLDLELDSKENSNDSPLTEVFANERYLQTRESILITPSKSFDATLKLFDRIQNERRQHIDDGTIPDVPPTPSRTHVPEIVRPGTTGKRSGVDAIPIIIVPSAVTSLITMWNAKEFLGAGVFITSDKKRETDPIKPEKHVVKIASRLDKTKNVEYHIMEDSALSRFEEKDWDRVVSVFATGANWQFKDFKRWHTPAQIFENVCGFHLYYDRDEINPNIAAWKVHKLTIGKGDYKRYNDRSVVNDFWQILGDWIAARNTVRQLAY